MHVDLTLKAVTPAFLGSDNPCRPEARIAPMRGALRYWLRAVVGGAIGTADIGRLRSIEEKVFGSTRGNSPVTARLLSTEGIDISEAHLLPHRKQGPRRALKTGVLKVRLATKPLVNVAALEMAAWSALVWTAVGGLGCRSRRAAGSLRLVAAKLSEASGLSDNLVQLLQRAATTQQDGQALATLVGDVIAGAHRAILSDLGRSAPAASEPNPRYPVLSPQSLCKVWCPAAKTPEEAHAQLMNTMSGKKAQLREAKFSQVFGGISPQRYASPLHVTMHQTEAGPVLVLTYLQASNPTIVDFLSELNPAYPVGGNVQGQIGGTA